MGVPAQSKGTGKRTGEEAAVAAQPGPRKEEVCVALSGPFVETASKPNWLNKYLFIIAFD